MSVERTYWYCKNLNKNDDFYQDPHQELREQVDFSEANLVSSLLTNGMHAPAIDIDLETTLRHRHLEVMVPADDFTEDYVEGAANELITSGFAKHFAAYRSSKLIIATLALTGPAELVSSRTPGHYHLYVDQEMPWFDYCHALTGLADLSIIEEGFLWAAGIRGMTFLRTPSSADVTTQYA